MHTRGYVMYTKCASEANRVLNRQNTKTADQIGEEIFMPCFRKRAPQETMLDESHALNLP